MPRSFLFTVAFIGVAGIASAQTKPAETKPPQTAVASDVAATVNGETIAISELDAILNANLSAAPLTDSQRHQLRAALLEDLINEKVLRQFLAKNAPPADRAEIDAQMTALKASLVKENKTLGDFLRQTGQTEAQLRDEWAASIQLRNYVKRDATDTKLKAYYEANRDLFDKVEVRISHIVIRLGAKATAVERAAAKEKLQAIRADVSAGRTTFAAAAKRYSQCASALKNGDLGFFPRRGLPENEPIAKAAFALKVGAISDVIETDYGVHILTVTERKAGTPSVLEKCVVEVLEAYTEDARAALVAKLRKEARVNITLP